MVDRWFKVTQGSSEEELERNAQIAHAEFSKVFRVNPNSPVEESRDIHMNTGWQYRLYLEMKNMIDSGKTATLEEVEIQYKRYNETNPWW